MVYFLVPFLITYVFTSYYFLALLELVGVTSHFVKVSTFERNTMGCVRKNSQLGPERHDYTSWDSV
jgi:hypothetical protein